AVWIFFGIGMVGTTFAAGMLILNLSLQGEELTLPAFIRSAPRQHILGLVGGGIWCIGAVAAAVAAYANTAPGVNGGLPAGAIPAGKTPMYLIANAAALLAALWGLVVWKENQGGNGTVRMLSGLTLLLFAAGLAMLAFSGIG
ncbi:MAG TPA: hypothetical protein VMU19_00160, partial [Bryobacteraceae bacterium]|nr:hypothetical protein [Bryobacteraceae bacterium]